MSGVTPNLVGAERRARSPEAGDDLVEDEKDAVAVADVAQPLEVPDGRNEDAGRSGDWFDDHRGDRVRPAIANDLLERVGELRAVARLAARERVGGEIVRVGEMVDRGGKLGRELAAVRLDAADGDAAEAHAMVAARPSDEPHALRLTLGLPVGEGDLERRIDGLGARVAEENVFEVGGEHRGELLRELERQRMAHLERRRVVHDARLFADGRGDRFPAMPGVHAPEASGAVENLAAVGCGVVHAVGRDEKARRLLEGAIRGEGEPKLVEAGRGGDGGRHGRGRQRAKEPKGEDAKQRKRQTAKTANGENGKRRNGNGEDGNGEDRAKRRRCQTAKMPNGEDAKRRRRQTAKAPNGEKRGSTEKRQRRVRPCTNMMA